MKELIKLLEFEVNQLGPAWNLFGKVDHLKYLLKKLKAEAEFDFEFDAQVEKKAFTMQSNHGILELKIPYRYDLIQHLDKDKRLQVSINYKAKRSLK